MSTQTRSMSPTAENKSAEELSNLYALHNKLFLKGLKGTRDGHNIAMETIKPTSIEPRYSKRILTAQFEKIDNELYEKLQAYLRQGGSKELLAETMYPQDMFSREIFVLELSDLK
jgi:hypothetical protein